MKFTIKKKSIPAFNTQRIIRKFSWSPIRIENEIRWLEFVNVQQVFDKKIKIHTSEFGGSQEIIGYWKNIKFIENGKM